MDVMKNPDSEYHDGEVGETSSNGATATTTRGSANPSSMMLPPLVHDGAVHHPLGGASYYFRSELVPYLLALCTQPRIRVHVGAQPNSAPHIGNSVTFAAGFALATALREAAAGCNRMTSTTMHHHTDGDTNRASKCIEVEVHFVLVDTAPSNGTTESIDGVLYQRALGDTHEGQMHAPSFSRLLDALSEQSGVAYSLQTQATWTTHPRFIDVLTSIVDRRDTLAPLLSPETCKLAIRAPCPVSQCGRADKHGMRNDYSVHGQIGFMCGVHGAYVVHLKNGDEIKSLGFNTPLRNLIRISLCSFGAEDGISWVMVTGGDYAGFYQERFLWSVLQDTRKAPVFVYAPLIVDWSGVKLSKSMYVRDGAYRYLREAGLCYVMDADDLVRRNGVKALYDEVCSWIDQPYKFFRNYSVEYMHRALTARGLR